MTNSNKLFKITKILAMLLALIIISTLFAQSAKAVVITSHWNNNGQDTGDFLTITDGESAKFHYHIGGPDREFEINLYKETYYGDFFVKTLVPWNKPDESFYEPEGDIAIPENVYGEEGTYLVVINAKDKYESKTYKLELIVLPSYEDKDFSGITITANPKTGNAPLTVTFTCQATGGNSPISYYWDFGDGKSSTSPNTEHTYDNVGNYTATCTAKDFDTDQNPMHQRPAHSPFMTIVDHKVDKCVQ